MNKSTVLALITLAAAAAGCATEPEPELDSTEQEEKCPWYACGNSPEIAHYGVWEANLRGARDINQVSLRTNSAGNARIRKNGIGYALSVRQGRIRGTSTFFGSISGTALVGSTIELLKNGAPFYNISITGVRPSGTAFAVGAATPIETYKMVWHDPGTGPSSGKALCNSVIKPSSDNKVFELYGMLPEETVVFEGDRIDTALKTMNTTADNHWFNFGCAGHTLAKLYILRNTVNTQPVNDWGQRQATLKMLVGDYCGTRTGVGETFTLAGEPIVWKGGLQPSYQSGAVLTTSEPPLDARWDASGAICMYEPRMQISSNPDAATLFPNARKQILDACPTLPICANTDVQDLAGARVISANRVPL